MPIIAVSRGTYAGAKKLCEVLAVRLRLPCLSRETLVEEAQACGLDTTVWWQNFEDPPGRFDAEANEREQMMTLVSHLLLERAVSSDFVYHGHHIRSLLNGVPNVLRVRVVAPFEQRVLLVQDDTGLSPKKAKAFIKRVDKQRLRWMRYFHDVKWEDPTLYDVTLNLEELNIDDAADAVCALAATSRFETTTDTRMKVGNAALAAAVRYALAGAGYLVSSNVAINATAGVVELTGQTQWPETMHAIADISKQVPGVTEVHNLIRSRGSKTRPGLSA